MAQHLTVMRLLKQLLKAKDLHYSDVAKALNLSESTIKRLFSQQNIDLKRLGKICHLVDMELSDLFSLLKTSKSISQLTLEQEKILVSDPLLLLVAVCVVNGWKICDIVEYYDINEPTCTKHLIYLHKINIIDLLPNNRFKLKISADFSWLSDGPVQNFFQKNIQQEFFSSRFVEDDETLVVRHGLLTTNSCEELQKKLSEMSDAFNNKCQADQILPFQQRHGCVLVIGMRRWVPEIFNQYKR
jgi:transcriptional regulator with XRE-family HTH domain